MQRKLFIFLCFLSVISFSVTAQNLPAGRDRQKPKLVVGLVVDQMRWDYLYRYAALYGANGFKRLLSQGFSNENTFIPYVPTYTAVGHTCVYTGSVPAITGIVGNNWFDKNSGRVVYCTDDSTVKTVGSTSGAGMMSPANMWTTTITDELKLSNNFKSKVIGIALKDRGAILPAGHTANAAYWYDDKPGKWITSSFYMNQLPKWVEDFNAKDLPSVYMRNDWNPLLPASKYELSTADEKPYVNTIKGLKSLVLPHRLSDIGAADKYASFKTTPYANTYTFDFAKAAIDNEAMGMGTVTDFLAMSISSTDYIGHSFGPNSMEIEDTYLRLDRDIADFLSYLDKKLGVGNYLFFLSSDHGVAHIPAFMQEHKIPAGTFDDNAIAKNLNAAIDSVFSIKKAVQSVMNYQVYLNTALIETAGKDVEAVKKLAINILKQEPYIIAAFTTEDIAGTNLSQPQKEMMIHGYNPKRSGDLQFTLKPGYFDGGKKGTTHGLWNPYDAHIPLVWFGWKVKPGKSYREVYMTDIAPTLAAMLQIQMPNGSVGKVIAELIK
ncbi:MAG: alkaline phosphatase PafA [Ferruginibacter sp.]